MKSYLLSALGALVLPLSAAESRSDKTWEFFATTKAGEEEISVRIITGPWEPSEHKIEIHSKKGWKEITGKSDGDHKFRIDGRESIWGADGFGWPDREVKLFVVKWGEKIINVPRKHWRDYYWLLLYTPEETRANEEIGGCWTKIGYDEKSQQLEVVANGGGGAGWYAATWKIAKDGTIKDSAEFLGE